MLQVLYLMVVQVVELVSLAEIEAEIVLHVLSINELQGIGLRLQRIERVLHRHRGALLLALLLALVRRSLAEGQSTRDTHGNRHGKGYSN
ncbi:MAG TPA: hypothetical protein VHE55_06220 [Fimbriimonadaceae bacterium]|nr:hypothetical protein [Fimbriimonadaceae bacterium]